MKIRGFKVCRDYLDKDIILPKRSTKNSAGYDFCCAEDVKIESYFKKVLKAITNKEEEALKPTLIKTGVKAYMQEDEVLYIYNRSSNPMKKGLVMANSVGVIDSDYFENPDNDGHIMFAFYNFYPFDIIIKKGDKIGQGVFQKFLITDDDKTEGERKGGFGSTGER